MHITFSLHLTHRRVRDLSILHRDIEIDTNEDFFALEVEVCDGEFVGERHGCRFSDRCLGVNGNGNGMNWISGSVISTDGDVSRSHVATIGRTSEICSRRTFLASTSISQHRLCRWCYTYTCTGSGVRRYGVCECDSWFRPPRFHPTKKKIRRTGLIDGGNKFISPPSQSQTFQDHKYTLMPPKV